MTSIARLMSVYVEVARSRLGWEVQPQEDGRLRAVADGTIVTLALDGADPEFVRVAALWRLESGDLSQRRVAAARTTHTVKLATAVADEDGVECLVDLVVAPPGCLPDPAHLAAVLPRTLLAIRAAADHFGTQLRG